ncbi:MAG: glutamine synthetase III, partial [Bacilli bacterium]
MPDKNFNIVSQFGIDVFGEKEMKTYLTPAVYKELEATIKGNKPLNQKLADVIAKGMKDWAISKGATHYTHWFQPLTGLTAEKHDSFISVPD